MQGKIKIEGARENNLKNISLEIPKDQLVVITGPSGSGKSTLALDVLQRESWRQFMESLGMVTYKVSKPKVDAIHGLCPSISVGQSIANRNPRSTVGTVTEIYTYLRILFAKMGERPCPSCGTQVEPSFEGEVPQSGVVDEEEPDHAHGMVHCPNCGHPLEKLTMTHFSFNKPKGACDTCSGLGQIAALNMDAVIDENRSLKGGGVLIWHEFHNDYHTRILKAAAMHYGFSFDEHLPIKDYSAVQRDLLLFGVESEEFKRHFPNVKPPKTAGKGKFEGVITGIWRRYREKEGEPGESKLFQKQLCPDCQGKRLKKEILRVTVDGASIVEVSSWSITDALAWIQSLQKKLQNRLSSEQLLIVEPILHDCTVRMKRLIDVGLGYLSLHRQVVTLSGGEAQRLRLAMLLGSSLTGMLYILDEPTAGLHPRDTRRLIQILKQLRDLGNTVLVIEHDRDVMQAADHIIDMGPGAGSFGGNVVGQGRLEDLLNHPDSVTGACFREEGRRMEALKRRKGNGNFLTIINAHARNLKNITVSFPLGCLISVTGVSGSGKSTLLFDVLAASYQVKGQPVGCERIIGWEAVGQLVTVDQSPLPRMKRSNIATYTEVYTHLRNLFAGLPEAKRSKLTAKHFSFNTPGGRCETCQGLGVVPVHMHFLPEMEVRCPSCRGKRFKENILRVAYKGHTISDLLDLTVQESLSVLEDQEKITETAKLLCEVGLGYLKWGQSVDTLSGGEAQRIKLAKELSKKMKTHALYLLDEPTTGLHPRDVKQLLVLLNKLVDAGNTVILVEHNLDLISRSDWVIDIGPEGGGIEASYTGRFLKEKLRIQT